MIDGMPSLDRAQEDTLTEEREEELKQAMGRGRLLAAKVWGERHNKRDLSVMLERSLGEESNAEEAIHALTQALYTVAGLLHMLGHMVPDDAEEMIDKYVDLYAMAETADNADALSRLLEDIMKAGGDGDH